MKEPFAHILANVDTLLNTFSATNQIHYQVLRLAFVKDKKSIFKDFGRGIDEADSCLVFELAKYMQRFISNR